MLKLSAVVVATTVLAGTSLADEAGSGELDSNTLKRLIVMPSVYGDYNNALNSIWDAYRSLEKPDAMVPFDIFKHRLDSAVEQDDLSGVERLAAMSDVALVQMGNMINTKQLSGVLTLLRAAAHVLGWEFRYLFGRAEMEFLASEPRGCIAAQVWFGKQKKPELAPESDECRNFKAVKEGGLTMVRWASSKLRTPGKSVDTTSTLFVHGDVAEAWVSKMMPMLKFSGTVVGRLNENIRKKMMKGENIAEKIGTTWLTSYRSAFSSRLTERIPLSDVCSAYLQFARIRFKVFRLVVERHEQGNSKVNSFCGGRVVFTNAKTTASVVLMQTGTNGIELQSMKVIYRADEKSPNEDLWFPDYLRASAEAAGRKTIVSRVLGVVLQRSKPAQVRVIGPALHGPKGDSGLVREVVNGLSGVVMVLPPPTSPPVIEGAVAKLAKSLGTTVLVNSPSSIFVEAECDAMLSLEVDRGRGHGDTAALEVGLIKILATMARHKIDAGITTRDQLLNSFCVSASGTVSFINWANVKAIENSTAATLQYKFLKSLIAPPKPDLGEDSTAGDESCLAGCILGLLTIGE